MADNPSSFGKPGDGPVISVVVRQRGAGLAGARVRLIVNGVGQPTLRSDREGAATWCIASTGPHPVRRANGYNYVVSAEKDESAGRATGHAQPLAPSLVVVDVADRRPASPAARAGKGIMQGAARESAARTTAGHHRIDLEHPFWLDGRRKFRSKTYPMCVPGLAFSVKHRGALVLVDVAGRELIVPTATDAQAARVREVIDYVHLNGWMTPHATRRRAS